jgi:hypothetical protein
MLISAELRWFWTGDDLALLREWFHNEHCSNGKGGIVRTDRYLRAANQKELGIKIRGTKPGVEIKGLVEIDKDYSIVDPFAGPIQIWCKWTSEDFDIGTTPLLAVVKERWLRKFDTAEGVREVALDEKEEPLNQDDLPKIGCNVELTKISLENQGVWWTLGFEAFGELANLRHSLNLVTSELAKKNPPSLANGMAASYPEWLSHMLNKVEREGTCR